MLDYAVIVAAVAFAAFHSGNETGTYCVNRLRLRIRAEQGQPAARALLRFVRQPRLAISGLLVGTNVGVYVATVLCTERLRGAFSELRAGLYSGLIMPPILLLFADLLPKTFFQHHSDVLMYLTIWPLRATQALFRPLALLLRWVGGLPHVLLGEAGAPARPAFTAETFRFYLGEGAAHGVLSSFQRSMAENILRLKSLPVGKAMIPLEEAAMAAEDAAYEDLLSVVRTHGYSRIPLYRGSREHVVGMVHVMDLACAEGERSSTAELARGVLTVRKDTSVADALWRLRQARQQLGVVTDADGVAVGIVTVKDLVEEIVGELEAW